MSQENTRKNHISNKAELIEHLYGIIDSKIQYMDYQTQIITSSFIDIDLLHHHPNTNGLNHGKMVMTSIMANNERILLKISEFSATTKLLLILRLHLNAFNALFILDLLTDNQYTQYTDEELTRVLIQHELV